MRGMRTFLGDTKVTVEYSDSTHTLTINGVRPHVADQVVDGKLYLEQFPGVNLELVLLNPKWTKDA